MSRTHIYFFKPKFVTLITTGQKNQTIRPYRKIMPKAGDLADLREWEGRPYHSAQRKILQAPIKLIQDIEIDPLAHTIKLNGETLLDGAVDYLARNDGFFPVASFFDFFRQQYGPKLFQGFITYW